MTISWKPYVWEAVHPASPHELARIEQEWGVSLPSDYTNLAITHQGMAPTPSVLDIGRGNTVVCELLTISLDEEHWGSSILEVYKSIQPHVPQGIYPFAATGAGDFICFDYRRSQDAPSVVFYFAEAEGEEAIYPVADNFTEFLSKLHD